MGCKGDLISELPLFILHHIQSYLPLAEAVRTSLLSKHWNSTFKSNPILCFDQDDHMMKNVDKYALDYRERLEEFLNFVDQAVQTFAQSRLRIESFFLHVRGVHACSFPLINAWLPFALRSGVCQLTFRAFLHPADQRIPYPLSETTFSTNSSAGSSKFFNLQRLILFDVNMSEKIIRDITSNCPNITELVFWRISGVKNIEISKLNKLEWLEMSMVHENKRIVVDAPSLLHFRCQDFMPWVSDLRSCLALKDLEVEDSEIIDEEIGVLMSRFPGLEAVTLTSCQDLEKVRISHLQLKSLKINHCSEIESIFINAPSLSKFTYEGTIVKFPQLSSKFFRGNMDVIYNLDAPARVVIDSSKFVDLRRFLEIPTRLKYLTISFFGNEVCFDSKAAGEDENPTLVKVDHLELKCQNCIDESRSAALLEGVFWSCRPKIISFATNDHVEISLQKILCEKLLRSEDRSCCKGTKRMCWHHGLKAAKIDFNGDLSLNDKSDGIEYYQFRLALDQLSIFELNKKVRFLLDWDDGTTATDQKDETVIEQRKQKRKAR